jgi:hypothetical protein
MRFGPAYYDARKLQDALFETACDANTAPRDLAQCVRSWIEIERLKREMRGIPPLAATKASELLARVNRARPAAIGEPVEI